MRLRRSSIVLAALLGVALATLPAVAASESLPIEAINETSGYYHHWSNATQTILAGESVKFSNPSSEVPHGLRFTGGPTTPTCSGLPAAATEESGATNWHGECSFSTPGTYTFVCTVHPEMTGSITVNANGTTTTSTTTPTTMPVTTTPSQAPETPLVGSVAQALKLAKSQRGQVVRGSIDLSKAGAGGRLEVELLVPSASLARGGSKARQTLVGRLARSSVEDGVTSFAVKLDSKALRALRRHHRLALTAKITLTPFYGEALTISRTIVQHI